MSETPAEVIATLLSRLNCPPSISKEIIAALAAAGYKIMAREPTEAMVKAGALVSPYATPSTNYRAMWDAAP